MKVATDDNHRVYLEINSKEKFPFCCVVVDLLLEICYSRPHIQKMVEKMDHVNDKDSGPSASEPAYKESSRGRRREMNISKTSIGGPSALSLLSGSFFLVFNTW